MNLLISTSVLSYFIIQILTYQLKVILILNRCVEIPVNHIYLFVFLFKDRISFDGRRFKLTIQIIDFFSLLLDLVMSSCQLLLKTCNLNFELIHSGIKCISIDFLNRILLSWTLSLLQLGHETFLFRRYLKFELLYLLILVLSQLFFSFKLLLDQLVLRLKLSVFLALLLEHYILRVFVLFLNGEQLFFKVVDFSKLLLFKDIFGLKISLDVFELDFAHPQLLKFLSKLLVFFCKILKLRIEFICL